MPAAALYIAHGAIDMRLVEPIISWINSCTADTVLVDTAAVTFIDSEGLRAFLEVKADLGAQARVFRIVNRSLAFDRLLAIAGLDNAFD